MDINTVAAQLYTLREFLKTPEDIESTLKRVKEIGYNAVQLSGLGPIEPQRLKEIADGLGLTICATHTSYERIMEDAESVIKEHKLWDCKYVGLGALPKELRTSKEDYIAFAKKFSEIGKIYKESGLQLIYHNHNFEFEKFDGITGMEILLKESDPETFGFEIDTYWVQAGGADPVEWIKKVSGRMAVVHLKDMAILDKQQIYAEIGQGNMNWTSILKACEDTEVKWYAVEQDKCLRDPFESLRISFEYLKSNFA